MWSYHNNGAETPAHSITRQGDRCVVRFSHPCAREIVVSAEAFEQFGEKDLYELCLEDLRRTLAACRLELARHGEPGAFCVRWKKD